MSISQQSQARTRMFARVVGPYLVIAAAAVVWRPSEMQTVMSEFGANSVWPFVTGAFTLLLGLVVIALHQYWRGPAAIIVSIVGWWAAIEGLFLLALPEAYVSAGSSVVDAVVWWQAGLVVLGLIGLYLTYVGWFAAAKQADAGVKVEPPSHAA